MIEPVKVIRVSDLLELLELSGFLNQKEGANDDG